MGEPYPRYTRRMTAITMLTTTQTTITTCIQIQNGLTGAAV
jgi:hypothetical protein